MCEFYLPLLSLKGLRACMNCSILKTFQQFVAEGCNNCEKYLKLKGNPERIILCTSLNFEAVIGITDKNKSWGSRIRNVEKFFPGAYAIYVFGQIPEKVLKEITECCLDEDMPALSLSFLSSSSSDCSLSSLST